MSARDRFVVVELGGRLGNQLFQFAAGLAIARRADARLVFSSRHVPTVDLLLPSLIGNRYSEVTKGELLRLGRFEYAVWPARVWRDATHHAVRIERRLRGSRPPSLVSWNETGRFRPELLDVDLPVYVQAHLESPRYFADIADEVDTAIELPSEGPTLPQFAGQSVAVSFRRGDYNSLGWALPFDYYEQALDVVAHGVGEHTLFLFGDDLLFLDLMEEHLRRRVPVVNAVRIRSDPISQLQLFTQCQHCVIANSSFAWWGAWLGDRRSGTDGRVVVGPQEYGEPDRFPEHWRTVVSGTKPW